MDTQSSTAVTLRALVMLLCLVTIPAAALFGTQLPGLVEQFLAGELDLGELDLGDWSPWQPTRQSQLPPSTESARPPNDTRRPLPLPVPGNLKQEPRRFQTPLETPPVYAGRPDGPPARDFDATLANYAPSAASEQSASSKHVTPVSFHGESQCSDTTSLPTAHNRQAILPDFSNTRPSRPAREPLESAADSLEKAHLAYQPGQFSQLEERLRDLGATYYLLETWGDRGEQYRFHCRVAVGGNPRHVQHFETTSSDPMSAMREVLARVEAFQASTASAHQYQAY